MWLPVMSFAQATEQCENQFITFCECKEFWDSYTPNLVILNLNTNEENTRSLGQSRYNSQGSCEQEMKTFAVCKL